MDTDPVAGSFIKRSAPRASFSVALALTMAVAAMVVPSLGALSSFIVDELAITRAQLGWLFSSVSVTSALVAPMSGKQADKRGGRHMLLVLLVMGSIVLLGLSLAPTYWILIGCATLAGVMNSIGNPATNRLIASELPTGSRGLVMGIKQSGIPFGIFTAGLFFPLAAKTMGWRSALAAASVVPMAIWLFARRTLPPVEPNPRSSATSSPTPSAPSHRENDLTISTLVIYSFLMGMGDVAIISFGPLYLQETLTWDAALAGQAIALAGALGIGARIFWGRWSEGRHRLTATLVFMAASSCCAALAFLMAAKVTAGLVWVGVALFGSISLAWNAIVYLLAIQADVADNPGRSSGFVMFGFMSGSTVGPIAFGYTVDLTGAYNLGWMVVFSSFAFAALHMVRASHDRRS